MQLTDATVLVTGANRGLGRAFAQAALRRGARKVYAAARDPATIDLPGTVPIRLDVTDADQVATAAALCGDVDVVVNNAGIARPGTLLAANGETELRAHLETNLFGILRMTRGFAPVLARNGGGAFLNALSVVSWVSSGVLGAYATSKSASWGLSNALRIELAPQRTQVLSLHVGFIDTDLTSAFDVPKVAPADVARAGLDALERGQSEVLADETARQVRQALAGGVYLQAPGR